MGKQLHRIQIDIDVEAESHEAAWSKVLDFWCNLGRLRIVGIKDSLVLEENEECCPTCSPAIGRPTLWIEYEEKRRADERANEAWQRSG